MLSFKEKDKQYVANTDGRFDVELVKGNGAYLYDINGKEYIDMTSGIGVTGYVMWLGFLMQGAVGMGATAIVSRMTGARKFGEANYAANQAAVLGFLAGVLFRKGLLRRSRGSLATFGAFAAVIIYGGIMNPAAALMYNSQTLNWEMLKAYYVSGLPMDLIHAAATVIFILIAAEPMLEKLDRIKVKYGLVE